MKNLKISLYTAESLIIFTSFIAITSFFPTGGVLTQNGRLTDFWVIPTIFLGVAVFLEKISEDKIKIPSWAIFLCSKFAAGVGLGLSFGAILILNEWYANPDNGMWEPLFTATGLSGAGVLTAERFFERLRKKQQDVEQQSNNSLGAD
jgi:hypothetical protein